MRILKHVAETPWHKILRWVSVYDFWFRTYIEPQNYDFLLCM